MSYTVDSYRHLNGVNTAIVKAWILREPRRSIPWTPLDKPLDECTVALVNSAAMRHRNDAPFDQEGERRNPWWGDPNHRVLDKAVTEDDIVVEHLHINTSHIESDLNCIHPIRRLEELEREGVIGAVASSHYSFMGYVLRPDVLLGETTPVMATRMRDEGVDVVVLVPA